MLKRFMDIGFSFEATNDGSPTLRLLKGSRKNADGTPVDLPGESMHHTAGAFSETCYIYGPLLYWGLQKMPSPRVMSIGLGLGYVEILTASLAVLLKKSQWQLDSFEIVPGLRAEFQDFFEREHLETQSVYFEILMRMSQIFSLSTESIWLEMKSAFLEKRLRLWGDLVTHSLEKRSYHVICQDAFSRKTSPELWDEVFLSRLLESGSEMCALGTYASLGALKRTLKTHGFEVLIREGFHGKRNCTLGTQGETAEGVFNAVPTSLRQAWKIS